MANTRKASANRTAVKRRQAHAAGRTANASFKTGAAIALGLGVTASPASAGTYQVTTLADSGAGSLRSVISAANINGGADIVTFESGLTGTITLTTGEIEIDDSIEIQGPGASVLAVSGGGTSRVLSVASTAGLEVTISALKITGGSVVDNGGGIKFGGESLTLDSVELSGNMAGPQTGGQGGGLWAQGAASGVTIINSLIAGNAARTGGGIFTDVLDGPLEIGTTRIHDNDGDQGAGLFIQDAEKSVRLEQSTVSDNTGNTQGGGIYVRYTHANATLTLRTSTVSGNSAETGGGLFVDSAYGPILFDNSTISGNQSVNAAAFYCDDCSAGLTFRQSTIASNVSSGDGAILVNTGTVVLSHAIVAANPVTTDQLVGNFTADHSLIDSPGSAPIATGPGGGNVLGQDPHLDALGDNGGPTFTQLPAEGSPAVNAGDANILSPPSVDQRGRARIVGGRIDIGAVERNSGTLQCSIDEVSVAESAGSVTLTVTRTGGDDGDVSVNYATANGTATAPDDFASASGSLEWANGESTSKTFAITIADDQRAESSETLTASLSSPNGASLGAVSSATVTITDDDAAPTISAITDQTVTAAGSTSPIPFTVADGDDAAASLTVSATSSNHAVVTDAAIVFGGSGEARTATITALAGAGGESMVTLSVSDGINLTTRTFKVTVTPIPGTVLDAGADSGEEPDGGPIDAGIDSGETEFDAAVIGEPGDDRPDAANTESDAAANGGGAGSSSSESTSEPSPGAGSGGNCGCDVPGRDAAPPKSLIAGLLGLVGLVVRRRKRSCAQR